MMRVLIVAMALVFCSNSKMQSQIISDHSEKRQDNSQQINVWFDTEGRGDTIEMVRVLLINNSKRKQPLSFELVFQQKETNTKVDQKQGFIEAAPSKVQMIAKVPTRFLPNDKFRLDITVYDQQQNVVDQDSIVQGNFKRIIKPKPVTPLPAKDPESEISGLVIDLTKSKQGRDFFEIFYQGYSALGKQTDYTILVEELPARGTVSRIGIKLNEVLIFQRFLTPRASIVEENAIFAVEVISQHLQNNESITKQLQNEDQQGTGIF